MHNLDYRDIVAHLQRDALYLFFIIVLASCATAQYTLLNPADGWIKLGKPLVKEKEIITSANDDLKAQYDSKRYDYVWFGNTQGEYLIYFHDHVFQKNEGYALSHCGDETVIFRRTDNRWIQTKDGKSVICVD